jgi:GABA permease
MTEQGMQDRHGLRSGLKRRHVTMIALGGVIGAGLFVGSGAVIKSPARGASRGSSRGS